MSGLGVPVEEDERGYMQMSSPSRQSSKSQRSPNTPLPSPHRSSRQSDSGSANLSSSRRNLLDERSGADRLRPDEPEPYFTSQVQGLNPEPYASSTDVQPKTDTAGEVSMKLRLGSAASIRYSANPTQTDGHEYSMIPPSVQPTSKRSDSVKKADSVLYSNRVSHLKASELESDAGRKAPRGRCAVVVLVVLSLVSACALGLAAFLLLRKSDDCSCSNSSGSTAKQTQESGQDIALLEQKISELEAAVARLNGSNIANSKNIDSLNSSLNAKFEEAQQIVNISTANIQTLNSSIPLKLSNISEQLQQHMTAISQLQTNQTQSMTGLNSISVQVANISSIAEAAAAQNSYAYAAPANAAAMAGYLFDNCTTQSFTCGFRALQNASRDACIADVVAPPLGWRILTVICEADGSHSGHVVTALRKYKPLNPEVPDIFCLCAFDGHPDLRVNSRADCIARSYICHTST